MRNQLFVVLFVVSGVACGSSGTGGQAGGSSGATGGASGSGGASGPSVCTWKGETYSTGESFRDDCNTCTCGALGDTLVRCTVMACFDGGAGAASSGSSGTGGISASGGVVSTGGVSGAGGAGWITMDGGDIREVGAVIDTASDAVATGGASDAGGAEWIAMDGGDIHEVGEAIDAAPDAVPSSACSACASDELCVAYYDGTCKPMQSTCNKVSAATRQAILVNHERCFAKAIGDEICGTQYGQQFWGCGEPPCGNETLPSDINCYGP